MTSDEMQNAIEFLLRNQASFEVQLEKTNQQLARTDEQLARTDEQLARTDEQLEQTSQRVSFLAETQTEFIQTMLRHVEEQRNINANMRQTMRDLAQAQQLTQQEIAKLAQSQQRTQQDISDLTKIVGGLVQTVYKNGNPPQA